MTDNGMLFDHLAAWNEYGPRGDQTHLDDATLYKLTAPGSLAAADAEVLRHLSLCPSCMAEWADWRRARVAAEDASESRSDINLSFGFLHAAASPELADSISMQSQCGSYRLDVLPQEDTPGRGLVIFEALSNIDGLEGTPVTIYDRRGLLLIKGHLREGRLARPIDDLSAFDLSVWTVSIGSFRDDTI